MLAIEITRNDFNDTLHSSKVLKVSPSPEKIELVSLYRKKYGLLLGQPNSCSTFLLRMHYEYNLRAVGIDSTHFPYLTFGNCMGLDCISPGAEVEFLKECLQSINATVTINPARLENGSADITLRTINQEHPRQKQVDFTMPIGNLYYGYFVKESTHVEVGDYLGDAFSETALLLVVTAGLTVSCLLHLFTKLLTKNPSSILSFTSFAFAGFFKNSQLNPEPISSRIIVLLWLLFSFALTEYYKAKLSSILLLTHYSGALFDNLDKAMDAMEYHGWKMVVNNSRSLFHCNGAQCTRLHELQKRSLVLVYSTNTSLEEAAEVDHQFGFGSLQSDIAPHEKTLLDSTKRILFVRDQLLTPLYRSYAVRKKMPLLLEKLNRAIARTRDGFSAIRRRYREPFQRYVNKHFQENPNVLTLAHLKALFDWTGPLLLFSFVVLLGEILHCRYSQRFLNWARRSKTSLDFSPSEEMHNSIELTRFSSY
ncbi:unnamed protein product [Cylicocyclus nassatus]|uniref:Ionotropic glutamate receptor C-terminal domain-containing protein n=1 Tax=Cylicocyclus nassatus TaxID=53992 RepID=A0AA36GZ72_CYLNA|nr:unnamed protein product [Cylicocyclus nassatus]